MTYIELINEFWKNDLVDPTPAMEAKFYFHLLNECNIREWINPFELQSRITEVKLLITRKTIGEVRNRLRQRGLIDFVAEKNKPTVYLIKNVNLKDTDCLLNCFPQVTIKKHETAQSGNNIGYNSETYIEDIRLKIQEKEKPPKGGKKKSARSTDETIEEYLQQSRDENYIRFLNWTRQHTPYVAGHMAPLTEDQFRKLREEFGAQTVRVCMENLENRKDLRKKYSGLYRTLINWCRREKGDE